MEQDGTYTEKLFFLFLFPKAVKMYPLLENPVDFHSHFISYNLYILYSEAKFACYARCFLTSYFCTPVPYNEKDIFWGCQFQKVLQVFIEPFNFTFFSIFGWGIDLDYCDFEWSALEMNLDHSVIFEIVSNYCISDSLADYDRYSISSKGFLPTVVDIMII